jgi:hypothetical protein
MRRLSALDAVQEGRITKNTFKAFELSHFQLSIRDWNNLPISV